MSLFDKMKDMAGEQFENLKSKDVGGKNIGDLVKPIENKTNELLDNYAEGKKELKLVVQVKKALSKATQPLTIRRDLNDYFYISNKYDPDAPRYTFDHFTWGGSTFTQTTTTKGEINTQGRSGSALVGGAIAGPIGAVFGGARKKKSKVDTTSMTTSNETGSKATIYLRNVSDQTIKEINTNLTSAEARNIENFFSNIEYTKSTPNQNGSISEKSPIDQLKELKELLDMGIVNQEEFDKKKKELLGL